MAKDAITTPQENAKVSVQGNICTVLIDISKNFGPSESGKSELCASTKGFIGIAPGVSLNLNVIHKIKK